MTKAEATTEGILRAADRSIILISILGLVAILYALAPIEDGAQLDRLSLITGTLLNITALWGIVWSAPKIVHAIEQQADATTKLANPQPTPAPIADTDSDDDAARLFDALGRFASRHPGFGSGVSAQSFRQLGWRDRQLYKRFMHRAVGFLGAIFDAAGPAYEAKWKEQIWTFLDRHPVALRRWRRELGVDQLT